jgi:predicted lipoprotein with Yx(FWY)xxD motif
MHKIARFLVLGLAMSALIAACSSTAASPSAAPSAAAPSAAAPSAAAPSAAAPSAEASAPAAAGTTIALADSSLGKIIVDGSGMTLYMFSPDTAGGLPTCYDDCAKNWPALVAEGTPTAGTGLDVAKLVVVDRTDGGKQVKFGQFPLYHFAADKAPGDTNGQGKGDSWYVVGADGEPIKGS